MSETPVIVLENIQNGADAFDMAESVGRLGAPLSDADSAAVELKPMRPFSEGELCAVKDPKLVALLTAAAAQERAGPSASTCKPALC